MLPQTLALPISVYHKSSKKSTIIKRDTADRINGLERPKPNEGYALKNGISNKSISQLLNFVNTNKKGKTEIRFAFFGAGNQNRTDDLVITNDVLYRLSHTSKIVCFSTTCILYQTKIPLSSPFYNFLRLFGKDFLPKKSSARQTVRIATRQIAGRQRASALISL